MNKWLLVLFIPTLSFAQSPLQNVNVSAAADFVAPLSVDSSSDSEAKVRSAEILLYGPIDTLFDGMINAAGHDEEGEFVFELHEAFVSSSKLIPQSRFRVGKFFLNVGRMNSFHQHDWPFTTAPKVQREFFSPGSDPMEAEGAIDTGVEYTWLVPTERFFEVTLGATNNHCYGHCHQDGPKPPHPLFYIHPTTFFSWGPSTGLLLGASYMNREDAAKTKTDLYGLEATFKDRQGRRLKWLWQSEIFFERQNPLATSATEKMGAYSFLQYGLDEYWNFGLRLDAFSQMNLRFITTGEKRKDLDYAFVPTITYKPSEFSLIRLSYSHEVDTTQGDADVRDRQFQLQLVYFLGAHPAHDF